MLGVLHLIVLNEMSVLCASEKKKMGEKKRQRGRRRGRERPRLRKCVSRTVESTFSVMAEV